MDNWLYIWYFLWNSMVFLTFVVPFCCVTHRSHDIFTAVSIYSVISFFETPLNLTVSFVYIFSRGLNKGSPRNSSTCTWFTFKYLGKRSLFTSHVHGVLDTWNIVQSICFKTQTFCSWKQWCSLGNCFSFLVFWSCGILPFMLITSGDGYNDHT